MEIGQNLIEQYSIRLSFIIILILLITDVAKVSDFEHNISAKRAVV